MFFLPHPVVRGGSGRKLSKNNRIEKSLNPKTNLLLKDVILHNEAALVVSRSGDVDAPEGWDTQWVVSDATVADGDLRPVQCHQLLKRLHECRIPEKDSVQFTRNPRD